MIICIIIGVISAFLGIWISISSDYWYQFLGGICSAFSGIILTRICLFYIARPTTTYYLEAEPLAYNTDTTIFSTPNGYYTANAIYDEDTVYLLTMNGMGTTNTKDDEILVVWKCDEGSVG